MKILAITQARISSTRFPEKILKTISGESLLEIHIKRIKKSKLITKIIVATTIEPDAKKIIQIAKKQKVDYYQGSINNVLDRFYKASLNENPQWIVRLTSDCPLIDAELIDKVINHAVKNDYDYVSNTLKPTFPDGFDVEVFKYSALKKAFSEAKLLSELEHVTPYIWKNSTFLGGNLFKSDCIMNDIDYSALRLTVDTIDDYELLKQIIQLVGTNESWVTYTKTIVENPDIKKINQMHKRNEGYEKSIMNDKSLDL